MQTIQSIDLIATNPKVRSGRPCIAGTGLEVSAIVIAHLIHNQTPDEIAADYRLRSRRSTRLWPITTNTSLRWTRRYVSRMPLHAR